MVTCFTLGFWLETLNSSLQVQYNKFCVIGD